MELHMFAYGLHGVPAGLGNMTYLTYLSRLARLSGTTIMRIRLTYELQLRWVACQRVC